MNLFIIMNIEGINRCVVLHLQARKIIECCHHISVYQVHIKHHYLFFPAVNIPNCVCRKSKFGLPSSVHHSFLLLQFSVNIGAKIHRQFWSKYVQKKSSYDKTWLIFGIGSLWNVSIDFALKSLTFSFVRKFMMNKPNSYCTTVTIKVPHSSKSLLMKISQNCTRKTFLNLWAQTSWIVMF